MNVKSPELLFSRFVRNYNEPFSVKEVKKIFSIAGFNLSSKMIEFYIDSCPDVLRMENGFYITKSGAFTGEIFSIMPTREEFEQGVMVIGDRCIPFLDSDRITSSYSFYINGKKIPTKSGRFDSDLAIDMFILFGEEYAPQYIASDPASDLDMVERVFELPSYVNLTGLDLDFLKRNYQFKKGDRILCCVTDWDSCKVNIMIMHSSQNKFERGEAGEKRLLWYSQFENFLLESFEKYGPVSSIEEQLINVYFAHRKELCVPYCGSVEEYLGHYAKKVGVESFGVETRLWEKGKEVPAFGGWNKNELGQMKNLSDKISFPEFLFSSVPEFIEDQYIFDSFYSRKEENLLDNVVNSLTQEEFSVDKKTLSELALNLKERSAILKKQYNWFRDHNLGAVRKKALDLYGEVFLLVCKLDYAGSLIANLPQQEVVILSQLYGHLLQIFEALAGDPCMEDSASECLISLEGMKWNFDEIRGPIEFSLQKQKNNRFTVLNLEK